MAPSKERGLQGPLKSVIARFTIWIINVFAIVHTFAFAMFRYCSHPQLRCSPLYPQSCCDCSSHCIPTFASPVALHLYGVSPPYPQMLRICSIPFGHTIASPVVVRAFTHFVCQWTKVRTIVNTPTFTVSVTSFASSRFTGECNE